MQQHKKTSTNQSQSYRFAINVVVDRLPLHEEVSHIRISTHSPDVMRTSIQDALEQHQQHQQEREVNRNIRYGQTMVKLYK